MITCCKHLTFPKILAWKYVSDCVAQSVERWQVCSPKARRRWSNHRRCWFKSSRAFNDPEMHVQFMSQLTPFWIKRCQSILLIVCIIINALILLRLGLKVKDNNFFCWSLNTKFSFYYFFLLLQTYSLLNVFLWNWLLKYSIEDIYLTTLREGFKKTSIFIHILWISIFILKNLSRRK